MYDELRGNLMAQATHFSVHDETSLLLLKAADAIEELVKENESLAADLEDSNERRKKKRKPQWIPVTERLPEEYEYVLCRTDYGMEVGYYRNEWGQDEWTTGKFASGSFNVTHWSPLPQPPKEDKDGA